MSNVAPIISEEDKRVWREREGIRLDDGTYIRIPEAWQRAPWFCFKGGVADWAQSAENLWTEAYLNHYVHVSTTDGAMIAFTENDAKGVADRQTRMKPGKYLTKFFSDVLDAAQITELATAFCAEFKPCALKFAADADDIERVYVNGPSSCMSHDASDYQSSEHPVRAYAGPDLQVAYIEPQENRITARVVVWPERKIHTRIYGDAGRLRPLLKDAGYTEGSLKGARIARIEDGDGCFVVPYIDHINAADDTGTYLRLGGCEIGVQCTGGLTEESRYSCDNCGDRIREDDGYYCDDDNETMCEHCNDNHRFYCDRLERTASGDQYAMTNGETWCEAAFDRYGATCDRTGVNCPADDTVRMENGETWSTDAFNVHGATCEGTGEHHPAKDTVTLSDGTVWSQDYFDDHGATDDDGDLIRAEDAPADKVAYRCPDTLPLPLATPSVNTWTPPTIQVGDWVEALVSTGNEFTTGRLYQVSRVDYSDADLPRLSVHADDRGEPNGWCANHFRRFHFHTQLQAAE